MTFDKIMGLEPEIIYLNHAAVAPWPLATRDAVSHFAEENARLGSKNYLQWLTTESELRQRLASLINAPAADDIALLKNTSEALSIVAWGIDWQAGDNLVISDQEFPSNRIVWESLQPLGVEVRQIDLASAPSPEAALLDAFDARTRLLSISSVQYATGLRLDVNALGAACQQQDVLFCVDAIQSIGAVVFDVQAMQADFVMADGHKWMLGPEGLALFYTTPRAREHLKLNQYGWHMIEHHDDFDRRDWQPAHSARRFECGSPNMLCNHALHASTGVLLDLGMPLIEQKVLENSRYLFELLADAPHLRCLTDQTPGRYAGIVVFEHDSVPAPELYHALMSRNVMCAPRGGGVRFSPHFYTAAGQIEKAVEIADKLAGKRGDFS